MSDVSVANRNNQWDMHWYKLVLILSDTNC